MPSLVELFSRFLVRHRRGGRRLSSSTKQKYQYDLLPFLEAHNHLAPRELEESHLLAWFEHLENEHHYRPATLAKHRGEIVCFINWLRDHGLTSLDAAKIIPPYSQKPDVVRLPREQDVARLLATAEAMSLSDDVVARRDAAIVLACYAYGNRRGELRMTSYRDFWNAVDSPLELAGGETAYILTTVGKGGKARLVLGETQKTYILRYLQLAPEPCDDALFMNLNQGHKHYRLRLSLTGMNRSRNRVLKRAGVGNITFQDLRRLRGTEVARAFGIEHALIMLHHKDGGKVFRDYYYDPDQAAAFAAALHTLRHPGRAP